jgi:hypothetical protein
MTDGQLLAAQRPGKATAPQPPWEKLVTGPPPYAAKGRGRPGYSESPAGRPGYPFGATMSLIEELQEHERTTTGHSLGMNETDLHGEGASALGGFDLGSGIRWPREIIQEELQWQ